MICNVYHNAISLWEIYVSHVHNFLHTNECVFVLKSKLLNTVCCTLTEKMANMRIVIRHKGNFTILKNQLKLSSHWIAFDIKDI